MKDEQIRQFQCQVIEFAKLVNEKDACISQLEGTIKKLENEIKDLIAENKLIRDELTNLKRKGYWARTVVTDSND